MMSSHEFVNVFYESKKTRNSNLSLRSIARLIGISPSYFSEILNGKKNIPTAKLKGLLSVLEIDDFAALYLKNCLKMEGYKDFFITDEDFLNIYRDFEEETFNIFKEWYYIPIMELTTTADFINDNTWIAKKLGVSEAEVGVAIYHLKKAGFLKTIEGRLKKTNRKMIFKTKNPKTLAQQYHRNMMAKSIDQFDKNEQRDFDRRTVLGYTLAVNPDVLESVMKKLKEDLITTASIATTGECKDVYQLNLQFFPLTDNPQGIAVQ